MNIEIANRLVELRKMHALSQEALAEKLGISRQAISKWERAEASPDTDNLMALSNLYGVSMDSILYPNQQEEPKAKVVQKQPQKEKAPKLHLPKTKLQQIGIRMLKFPLPLFVIALYLGLGFWLKLWHPAWLLFIILPLYYHLGGAFCVRRKKAMLLALPVPELIGGIYLILGVLFKLWTPYFLILLIIPLYYWLVACFFHDEQSPKKK